MPGHTYGYTKSSAVAEYFVSLNISLNDSISLNVIENGTIPKFGYGFLFAFNSK